MATATVAWMGVGSNVGKVVACDADNGWDGSLSVDTVTFIEGTASLGEKVSATTTELYTVNTTDVVGEPFDFSSSGGNDGDHIFGWLNIFAAWDTQANGGFGLRVADNLATDSLGTWYVGPQSGYLGGWASYVINPSADFDGVVAGTASWTTTGNPAQLSGVDGFGCRWKVTVSITGNTDNAFVDCISVGQGYRITLGDAGSTEGAFSDFTTFEGNTTSGRYGGLREISGLLLAKSKLLIGAASGATNTEFIDSGFTVVWEEQGLSDGSSSAVASGFYEFSFSQGTGTTDVDISSGTLACVSPHTVVMDWSGVNSVTADVLNIERAASLTLDVNCTVTDCKITDSGQIACGTTSTGAVFTNNTVSGYTGAADTGAILWEVNSDPDGNLDSCTIISHPTTAHHAIDFSTAVTSDVTLRNIEFTDFSGTDDVNDSTLRFLATTGSLNCNLIGCTVGGAAATTSNIGVDDAAGIAVTLVIDPVDVTITIVDASGTGIQNVQVSVYLSSDDSQVMNALTNVSGVATTTFSGTTPANCYIRWRKSSTGSTRYVPESATGVIEANTGLTAQFIMREDEIVQA